MALRDVDAGSSEPQVGVVARQITKVVGSTIRRLREAQKFSQEGFAQTAGIDRSYYGRIERGTQNLALNTLCIIAYWLKVHPSVLLMELGDTDLELLVEDSKKL